MSVLHICVHLWHLDEAPGKKLPCGEVDVFQEGCREVVWSSGPGDSGVACPPGLSGV